MRERLHHLATIESLQNSSQPEFSRWADTRLDRWLVDWCLRNGKENTARKIAKEKNIEVCGVCISCAENFTWNPKTLVDIELFTDIKRIEDALSKHSCTDALAWCSENKSALRKIKVRSFLGCIDYLNIVTLEHLGIWSSPARIHWTLQIATNYGSYCVYEEVPDIMARNPPPTDTASICATGLSAQHSLRSLQGSKVFLCIYWRLNFLLATIRSFKVE